MNVEKHSTSPVAEREAGRHTTTLTPDGPVLVLRLDLLPATPASLARIRRRVEEINWQLRLSEAPFRLRVM